MTIDTQRDAVVPGTFAAQWGWFVAAGLVMLVFGIVAMANILVSTVATVLLAGALMVAAGIAQIIAAFPAHGWGATLLAILAGALYLIAGAVAFADPLLASAVLTLALAVSLLVSGISRIAFGIGIRPASGWGWIVAGGVVSLVAGILIAMGWPGTLWVLGVILAVDLISQGVAYTSLGLALRQAHR